MLIPLPGTYALVYNSPINGSVRVGQWGVLRIKKGYYIYVGSAFVPGGLRARVLRHCVTIKPIHWYIDYLRALAYPVEVVYSHDAAKFEHQWARVLMNMKFTSSINGFGSSDGKCESHLFFAPDPPRIRALAKSMEGHARCEVLV